jgi:endonuclease-3 related protein
MKKLLSIYNTLLENFGPQGWWPAETDFEVIVGAILTQATSWSNVEKSISNLKKKGVLNPKSLHEIKAGSLAKLIKSSGYFNAKARKLKCFMDFLHCNYDGNLSVMLSQPKERLRKELLEVWGVGPETADSIILYAAHKPSFVVDAYTKRIFSRIGFLKANASYDEVKHFFEKNLPKGVKLYKEYHALVVELGKTYCRKKPLCKECCVNRFCSKQFA